MIDESKIPKLKSMWAEADRAFRSDDCYVLDMADEVPEVLKRRASARRRRGGDTPSPDTTNYVSIEWRNAWGAHSAQMVPREDAETTFRSKVREARREAARMRRESSGPPTSEDVGGSP